MGPMEQIPEQDSPGGNSGVMLMFCEARLLYESHVAVVLSLSRTSLHHSAWVPATTLSKVKLVHSGILRVSEYPGGGEGR